MDKKIYIKPREQFPINSVKDLISALYKYDNGNRNPYALTTYSDEDCTRPECTAGRRSFEDLLCLARTYFPATMETELMAVLKELQLRFYVCNAIHKIVFHYNGHCDLLSSSGFERYAGRSFITYAEGTYTAKDLIAIYEATN